uniref:MRH domain-containing protein n=1 Tax=Periophthalmus magnuspinnatus TaxID=409849 RepID=A0A3B4B5Q6_9GOBI
VPGSYKWEAIDQDNSVGYSLKLCESSPSTSCGQGAAVCSHELSQIKVTGYVVDFNTTEKCPGSSNNFQASISFQCGKTMGTPEFVAAAQCVHYFEWRTYLACKKDTFKPHKEVPCYAFGPKGKHDLNPLIKVTSGYLVDDGDDNIDFYINICRSLLPDKSCPQGSAACLITSQGAFDMGSPTTQLELLSNDLRIQYVAVGPPPDMCNQHAPTVTITFICPSNRNSGSPPKMIAETNCRYEVEWVTEYACHRDYLESHNCKLTSERHDISIDLSPLTMGTDTPYHAFSGQKDSPESYNFYLNVCGRVQTDECGTDGFISSCQVKTSGDIRKVAGRYQNQTLYSDGDLTLIYPDGTKCSTGFQRMTMINFECNENIHGNPVYAGETDCTYYFDWETPYACVKEKEDLLCSVLDGKKHYDLSPLTRFPSDAADNWEVVDAKPADADPKRFYLNVCHKIIQTAGASGCPEDAAICAKNKTISLGNFLSSPQKTQIGNDIRLIYTNGDICSHNTRIQTILTLKCKPFSFDLSPLTKPNGYYNLTSGNYDYYINVCGPVTAATCPLKAGACQSDKSSWSLGEANSHLSYYNGLIQLTYSNGSQYNNKQHTLRSTLISFLCDPQAGVGKPDFQAEDDYTYNFRWYTSYACPERPHKCLVTDPKTLHQYDLSLSRSSASGNWLEMDLTDPASRKKYYINVCRPINPVQGCDRHASVCQMKVSNMGVSKRGPIIEGPDRLRLEFTEGSECISDGVKLNYTTHIHLVCSRGTVAKGPRFMIFQNCTAKFNWETRAACAIKTTTNTNTCSIVDPNTGFEFNLQSLASKTGYKTKANGKDFLTRDTFIINFVCNRSSHPGKLTLVQENLSSISDRTVRDAMFEFATPLVCVPAPVSCRISSEGNEYDLSHLARDNEDSPWIPIDADGGKSRKFYINVCRPLPSVKDCPGPLGACGVLDGTGHNLGYIQSSPQVAEDGSISIVYQNGDKCGESSQYSTRIIFQCDDRPGSPMFDRTDGCEHVFVWRTSEACPIKKSQVDCRVQDPQSGYEFNLNSLKGTDYSIVNGKYTYFLSICGGIRKEVCATSNDVAVSSCQVDGSSHKIALESHNLIYVDGQIILNYTNGETCHKIYQRTTEVYFSCDPSKHPGEPQFVNETPDCTYMFTWPTSLACIPVKTTSCSYSDGQGHSYDLSSLAMDTQNWVAEHRTGGSERFYINVCRSLVQQGSWKCPSSAASCMKSEDQYVSLGQVVSAPTMDGNILKLHYANGQTCRDGKRQSSTTINLQCDKDRVDSRPSLISVIEDCEYTFHWLTAVACPLNTTQQEGCKVTNPSTYQFDLNSLTKAGGYTVRDSKDHNKSFQVNVCADISSAGCTHYFSFHTSLVCDHLDDAVDQSDTSPDFYINVCRPLNPIPDVSCPTGAAVCMDPDNGPPIDIGQETIGPQINNATDEVFITYSSGTVCASDPSKNYTSTIIFTCQSGLELQGSPQMLRLQDCVYLFEWTTPLVCPDSTNTSGCRLTDSQLQFTFDLSALSDEVQVSSGPSTYYISACGSVKDEACKKSSVCEVSSSGLTKTTTSFGISKVMTMDFKHEEQAILTQYGGGDICPQQSSILFICDPSAGRGSPQLLPKADDCAVTFEWRSSLVCPPKKMECKLVSSHQTFDLRGLSSLTEPWKFRYKGDEFVIGWETRSACAVKQQEVKMENGTIHVPETGVRLSLGALYFHHQASGDIRSNGDRYIYHIQLSGITNSSLQNCLGANICQVKLNAAYRRKIGSSSKAKYYVKGNLDVMVPSESQCGREKTKMVSSTIMFHCTPSAGMGIPEFMLETDECQYLFVWHTDAICGLTVDAQTFDGGTTEAPSLSGRSRAVAVVLSLMLIGLTVCLLGLVLYKRERELVIQKMASCCRRGNQVSYKYSKVNMDDDGGEEEMEWLMEDLEAPLTFASHRRGNHHGNGHITTKHVNTDGLHSFSLDEQDDDSEDEVLNVPGVRVVKSNAP